MGEWTETKIIYADTDSVRPYKDIQTEKCGNYSIGYINHFKREWDAITGKLRRFPRVMSIPLVPDDRHHEKMKRIKI